MVMELSIILKNMLYQDLDTNQGLDPDTTKINRRLQWPLVEAHKWELQMCFSVGIQTSVFPII